MPAITSYFFTMLLQRSPALFVVFTGIVVALVRWRRHPRVSLVAIVALLLYLIKFVVFTGLDYAVLQFTTHAAVDLGATLFGTLDVLYDIASAAMIVLFAVAAFMKRQPVTAPNR